MVGLPGALVEVIRERGAHKEVWAKLRVAVVDQKKVKLSIRHVQVPGADGNLILHSKKPCVPKEECAKMNGVWTPQTNIAFDLISSDPVPIDFREKSTREDLAKAFRLGPVLS